MALVRCNESFFDASSGTEVFVQVGEVLEETNALVKAHASLFVPVAITPKYEAPAPKAAKRAADK